MSKYFKTIKSYENLKTQYKELLKMNHPDNGGDLEVMKEINVEYDALFPIWKTRREVETETIINETAESTRRQFYTVFGWEGSRYNSSMSTTEISKVIKMYCKEKYPTWKFSVTSKYFSGGSEILICVMEAPEQIFNLAACRKAYAEHLKSEKMGYYGGRGLGLDIEKMLAEDNMHWQLHRISDTYKEYFTEYGFSVLSDVYGFMQSYNYDDSDGMIDYFDCNFYSSIYIGKWNKGFKVIPKTARIKNKATKPAKTNRSTEVQRNAIEETSKDVDNLTFKVSEDTDTRTNEKIYLVKIAENLSREDYIKVNKHIKSIGGYYSKFKHAFLFKENPTTLLNINKSETASEGEEKRTETETETPQQEETKQDINFNITEDTHTKTGTKIWIVSPDTELNKQDFAEVKRKFATLQGFYSNFKHGFIFKYDPTEKLSMA